MEIKSIPWQTKDALKEVSKLQDLLSKSSAKII